MVLEKGKRYATKEGNCVELDAQDPETGGWTGRFVDVGEFQRSLLGRVHTWNAKGEWAPNTTGIHNLVAAATVAKPKR